MDVDGDDSETSEQEEDNEESSESFFFIFMCIFDFIYLLQYFYSCIHNINTIIEHGDNSIVLVVPFQKYSCNGSDPFCFLTLWI